MAIALDNGGQLKSSLNMHPFFQAGRGQCYVVSSSNPHETGADRSIAEPHEHTSDDCTIVDSTQTEVNHAQYQISTKMQPSSGTSMYIPYTSPAVAELESDPNGSRRKRRRVSPKQQEPGKTSNGQHSHNALPLGNGMDTDFVPPLPTVISTRDGKHSGRQMTSEQNDHKRPEDPVQSDKQTTPRKHVLRLGSNGKLTDSPRRSPRQSKETNTTLNQSNKRVELKNGKFVSSLPIKFVYGTSDLSRTEIGQRIQEILSQPVVALNAKAGASKSASTDASNPTNLKSTHPFFLGKVAPKPLIVPVTAASTNASDEEAPKSPIRAKPWQDIKFSSNKAPREKSAGRLYPLWPPLETHNVDPGPQDPRSGVRSFASTSKEKARRVIPHLDPSEDMMALYCASLRQHTRLPQLHRPIRQVITAEALLQEISTGPYNMADIDSVYNHPAIQSLKSRILTRKCAFDRGVASDSHIWPIEYGPKSWEEVLQPECVQLHEWLKGLKVHSVQKNMDHSRSSSATRIKKKKAKRRSIELDDFLVGNDEDIDVTKEVKNIVLIVGPSGCGKTASVYAVAHQLGFEVFEINPGMRRSAKDVYDRVGDMTRNHLVQRAGSRIVQTANNPTIDTDSRLSEDTIPRREELARATAKLEHSLSLQNNIHARSQQQSHGDKQKQSLILFEEVDLIFDDDKAFWTGVQSLAQQSKRPVVLTCNDLASVPLDQLPLHAVLHYNSPPPEKATELLVHIAAAEGHLISREAIDLLYKSKNYDLRASITELNFWCQMTVGSTQGGLDWMFSSSTNGQRAKSDNNLRIVSKDTFTQGMDLVPNSDLTQQEFRDYLQRALHLSVTEVDQFHSLPNSTDHVLRSPVDLLGDFAAMADAMSVLDLMNEETTPLMSTAIQDTWPGSSPHLGRRSIPRLLFMDFSNRLYDRFHVQDILFPLNDDPRVFPAPLGRPGPSIDTTSETLITEIAPYVRSIVNHEQHLSMIRDAIDGVSRGKGRQTRAARAAVEGGDKATTRREHWFPKNLNFEDVISTGSKSALEAMAVFLHEHGSPPASTASTAEDTDIES